MLVIKKVVDTSGSMADPQAVAAWKSIKPAALEANLATLEWSSQA